MSTWRYASARSSFYDQPTVAHDDTAIVEAIAAICDELEFYGWRRVRAELRYRGMIANHKKVRRLMREHDLQRCRRRYVATPDSDHDQPIYPNRTRELTIDGPSREKLFSRILTTDDCKFGDDAARCRLIFPRSSPDYRRFVVAFRRGRTAHVEVRNAAVMQVSQDLSLAGFTRKVASG